MGALSQLGARELVWRYPRAENGAFELSAGGAELGWLRFDERPGISSVGELGGERWTFRHTGGPRPRVTVSKENSPDVIAEYQPRASGGGVVSFTGGPDYCWNHARIWSPTWCFRRQGPEAGSSVCVSQQAGPLRDGGRVKLCGDFTSFPEAPVLVLLAWYLRVLAFEMLTESIPVTG